MSFQILIEYMLWEFELVSDFIDTLVLQFPFFCSDREYIIGRRIWECGRAYYCVTKVHIFSPFSFKYLFFLVDTKEKDEDREDASWQWQKN